MVVGPNLYEDQTSFDAEATSKNKNGSWLGCRLGLSPGEYPYVQEGRSSNYGAITLPRETPLTVLYCLLVISINRTNSNVTANSAWP